MVIVLLSYLWKRLFAIVILYLIIIPHFYHMSTTVYTFCCCFCLTFVIAVAIVVAIAVVFVAISYP